MSDTFMTGSSSPIAGAISSVNGKTGIVTLSVVDIEGAVATSDGRLSDQRVPTDGSVTAAKLDTTLKNTVSTAIQPTSFTYTTPFGGAGLRSLPESTAGTVSTASPIGVLSAFAFTEAQAIGILNGVNNLVKDLAETKKVLKQLIQDLQGTGIIK